MRMTMPSVVRHYLRWFELSRHKETMSGFVRFPLFQSKHRFSRRSMIAHQSSESSWSWSLNSAGLANDGLGGDGNHEFESSPVTRKIDGRPPVEDQDE
jgi:hypothetical protein